MPYTTSEQIRGQSTKHFMKNEARDFKTAEDIEKEKAPKHPEELRGLKPFDLFKAIW